MTAQPVRFDHLIRLSDDVGVFEHAELTERRPEHGYCVDDVARALVVTTREPDPTPEVLALSRVYLTFLADAQVRNGRFHNRRAVGGGWTDQVGLGDWWGRALWGLGTAAARSPLYAEEALRLFGVSADHRAPWSRTMAFAALGAAEVVTAHPAHRSARALLENAARFISAPTTTPAWPWPEQRLRYANAALPEVLIAAGSILETPEWTDQGLEMLGWLLDIETAGDHLSVVPTGGWAAGEPRPGFDQQPIEVAALSDACARAHDVTGEIGWQDGVALCTAWFEGANDAGVTLHDPVSGGGYDGLEPLGRNENEGAESTLALISTLQQSRRLLVPAS
ncbi:MAG: glycosyltransferase [Lapillicoccus sp.]